ncbi:MAG: hypothetical protein JMDDDDMK_02615 [Acidobacteria bacterium]|nr:hypothetical protein [Acidobacteriota bacterium]
MNQERISTPGRPLSGLRSRYHAFLEKHKEPASPSKGARFGQGLRSFAIFSVLFVAILTVFGVGLSWFGADSKKNAGSQSDKAAMTETSASALPAQPAGPAGHADIRSQTADGKKTDGK